MYGQRRGLAAPVQASDVDARNANLTLMHSKRRQQLEMQLEEKMELLKQYTNPRAIGMRGQTVPQRDVELLQQQIASIRQQLDGGQQGGQYPHTPSSQTPAVTPPSTHGAGQPHRVTATAFQQVVPAYPFPTAPTSSGSTGSRRDEVWQQKYEGWLRRNNGAGRQPAAFGGSSAASGVSSVAPSSHASQPAWLPPQAPHHISTSATPSVSSSQFSSQPQYQQPQQYQQYQQPQQYNGNSQQMQQKNQFQSQQQHGYPQQRQQQGAPPSQEQQIMFGRRATPPNDANRTTPQQPQPVHASNQPHQTVGRRAQQPSQRPW